MEESIESNELAEKNEENVKNDVEKNETKNENNDKVEKETKQPPKTVWNEKEGRFIPMHRSGRTARRRINQIHLPGPKNRKGAIGTLNRHAGVCFKIPQVLTVIARVCNYDAAALKYDINECPGFTGQGETKIFTSKQPVRSMYFFCKIKPVDFDPEPFDPYNLATPEGKCPEIEREAVIGNYEEITEDDSNQEGDKNDNEENREENGKSEEDSKHEDSVETNKNENEDNETENGKKDGFNKGTRSFPWKNPDRERLSLVFQGPDGFKVEGITCIKASFAEKDNPSVPVPGNPDLFYMVQAEHDNLVCFTGPCSPFPEDENCLKNGEQLGHVVILNPRDVFCARALSVNMSTIISTIWNPDPPKFLTKERAEEVLVSEEAQALVKQRDEQHKIKMIQFNKEKKQRRGKESGRQRGDNRPDRFSSRPRGGVGSNKRFRSNDHSHGPSGKQPRSISTRMPWDDAKPELSELYRSVEPQFGRGSFQHPGKKYDPNRDSGYGMKGFGGPNNPGFGRFDRKSKPIGSGFDNYTYQGGGPGFGRGGYNNHGGDGFSRGGRNQGNSFNTHDSGYNNYNNGCNNYGNAGYTNLRGYNNYGNSW